MEAAPRSPRQPLKIQTHRQKARPRGQGHVPPQATSDSVAAGTPGRLDIHHHVCV